VGDQRAGEQGEVGYEADGSELKADAGGGDDPPARVCRVRVGPCFRRQSALALFGGHRITSMLMTFSPLAQMTR
jgi:hypothetical protein